MREEGRRIICDRCGKTEFFCKTGTRLVDTASGYKTRTDYESSEKWGQEKIDEKFYDFCPACSGQYHRMLDDFVKPINSIAYDFYKEEINGISERKSE